jgi:hypothetical protein
MSDVQFDAAALNNGKTVQYGLVPLIIIQAQNSGKTVSRRTSGVVWSS